MKWYVTTKDIDNVVEADDQWEAFDSLCTQPADVFGIVVEAQPVNETQAESYAIRTSLLMGRWGRIDEAKLFIEEAVKLGLPDTTEIDEGAA